jgi:ribosome biogenesis protein ERB1
MDDPNYWRTVRDKVTGKKIVLSDDQIDAIQGLQKSKFPAATTDPYEVGGWMSNVEDSISHSLSLSLPLPSIFVPPPPLSLQPYIDHFTHEKELHPLSSTVKPKSSFVPSHWEHKKIVKIAHAIRMGWIKPRQTPAQRRPNFYLLWGESDKAS